MNGDTLMLPAAISDVVGCGRVKATASMAAVIRNCMVRIHHLLLRIMSTNGLHSGLIVHGR